MDDFTNSNDYLLPWLAVGNIPILVGRGRLHADHGQRVSGALGQLLLPGSAIT